MAEARAQPTRRLGGRRRGRCTWESGRGTGGSDDSLPARCSTGSCSLEKEGEKNNVRTDVVFFLDEFQAQRIEVRMPVTLIRSILKSQFIAGQSPFHPNAIAKEEEEEERENMSTIFFLLNMANRALFKG